MKCSADGKRPRTPTSLMVVSLIRSTTVSDQEKVAAVNRQIDNASVLIVPGFKGSDKAHWQSWLNGQLPDSRILSGVNWSEPVLAEWAERVREELRRSPQPL